MFRFVIGAAVALVLATAGFAFAAFASSGAASGASEIIAYSGLFLASVATLTGAYFGWRRDRREATKASLEVEKLRHEIERLQGEINREYDPDR